jgi:hypothetical protein
MTELQESSRSWLGPGAAIAAILVIALILLAVFIARGSNDAGASVEVTPISGGVALPAELAVSADSTAAESESEREPEALAVGTEVTSISAEGDGTRLYSDADESALIMELLTDGDSLVIVETSGDYEGYPVLSGESEWYRVRTSDGLVGWAKAEQLLPIE